jgi:opacity protein-like surface antigen
MRKKLVLVSFTFWLCVTSSVGLAQEGGPDRLTYLEVSAGIALPQEMESDDRTQHESLPNIDLSDELWLAAKIGHTPRISNWTTPVAIELEGSMITKTSAKQDYYLSSPFGSGVAFGANVYVKSIMVNFMVRRPKGRIHPYLGFGLGWVWFDMKNVEFILEPGYAWPETGSRVNDLGNLDDNAFGYQFLLGSTFDLTDALSLRLGHRYFRTEPEIKFRGVAFDRFQAPIVLDVRMTYKTHIFDLGLIYRF